MYRSCISAKTFAEAYRHAFHATQRFLRSFGYSLEIAEEMAQAAWAKAWQHRRQLRNPESVAPWVNSIALNIIRDFDRATKSIVPPRSSTTIPTLSIRLSAMYPLQGVVPIYKLSLV